MAETSEEMLEKPSSWCDSEELKSLHVPADGS